MSKDIITTTIIPAFFVGVLTAVGAAWLMFPDQFTVYTPIVDPDEVHVHADFLVYIDHERIRFTDDKYQSSGSEYVHPNLHLHSNNDNVIHRHAEDEALGDFFASLGYSIGEDCVTTDFAEAFCVDERNGWYIYVNGEIHDDSWEYVFEDEDAILVYYGDPADPRISTYLEAITDDACLYSGTCPERGVAPPSDCGGITCEV